jgi:hypothetical protein
MREQGEVDALFVQSENYSSDILTKNLPGKLLMIHGRRIPDGKLQHPERTGMSLWMLANW